MDSLPIEEVLALPVYPTADIFPMLLDAAEPPPGYDGLTMPQFADQILLEGIREPLVLWNGFLLDGRNRREAARLVNKAMEGFLTEVPVRYVEFETEEEADSWVLSLNIDRRALNKDQLACLAVRYWEITKARLVGQGARTDLDDLDSNLSRSDEDKNKERTAKILADRFHVSNSYVSKARSLFINDRPKFDLAASGKQRVLSSLKSPGQDIRPELTETPLELAQKKFNNAENHVRTEIKGFRKVDESQDRLQFILDHLDALKEFAVEVWSGDRSAT